MHNRIETKKVEQYSFKLDLYEVVLEYVESADRLLHMDVTIHTVDSSGVFVLKSRPALDSLIALLGKAAQLDDEKNEERRKC